MKRPKKKGDDTAFETAMPSPVREEYGWGLRIRLENFELDKLGMKLPAVGQKMTVMAVAEVVSVHQASHGNADEEKTDRGVELQIVELGVEKAR